MEKKRRYGRRKYCVFCSDENLQLDYKNPQLLKNFVTNRGKIIPSRISGTCSKHQRQLTTAIKRARMVAFMPFTTIK